MTLQPIALLGSLTVASFIHRNTSLRIGMLKDNFNVQILRGTTLMVQVDLILRVLFASRFLEGCGSHPDLAIDHEALAFAAPTAAG